MSVRAHVVVRPEVFRLRSLLESHPDLRVELERIVPLAAGSAPYLWVHGGTPGRVEDAIEACEDVGSVELIERTDDQSLVHFEWSRPDGGFAETLTDAGATCLRGVGTSEAWNLVLRFPAHERLADCYQACANRGIDIEVQSVHNPARSGSHDSHVSLTDPQRETLQAALESGYFSVPRETTLQELAERLGVSDTAASQRLRRGLETVVVDTFGEPRG